MAQPRGLTLLELLVVLAIIGLSLALVSLSLRPSTDRVLLRDASRLQAQLEAARVQARAQGLWISWHPEAKGYRWQTNPAPPTPSGLAMFARVESWSNPHIRSLTSEAVLLGPEPILAPARIVLEWREGAERAQLEIVSDGLGPFAVRP